MICNIKLRKIFKVVFLLSSLHIFDVYAFKDTSRDEDLPIRTVFLNSIDVPQESYAINGHNFRRQNVSGKGMRCFFNAIGLETETEIAKLRSMQEDPLIRVMIANEIVSAAANPEQLPDEVKVAISYSLYEAQRQNLDELDELRSNMLRAQNPDGNLQDTKILPPTLRNLGQNGKIILQELRERALTIEAFNAFLDYHIGNEQMMVALHDVQGNGDANLTSVDAIAYINKIALRIYQPARDGGLRLTHQYTPHDATEVSCIYHQGVHFEALILDKKSVINPHSIEEMREVSPLFDPLSEKHKSFRLSMDKVFFDSSTEGMITPIISPRDKNKETFYIFNMGEGNSQLATYDEEGENSFGILYDCGSSTEYTREKVAHIRSESSPFKTFLNKISFSMPNSLLEEMDVSSSSPHQQSTLNVSGESSGSMTHDSVEKTEKKATDVSNAISIKDIIRKSSLKSLFVFLSHPDKDHINLISQSIPSNLKILFILCGDFLSYNQYGKLSEDVHNTLLFISQRYLLLGQNKNHLCLPYFWTHEEYNDIKKSILSYFINSNDLEKYLQPIRHTPPRVQGSLNKFLQIMKEFDGEFTPNQHIYKNIYIWLLNKTSNESNNTCPIISFRMPTLQQSFICTGDSQTDVFGDISQYIGLKHKKNEFQKYVQKKLGFSTETQEPYLGRVLN